jgi:hypothetical protein
MRVHYEVEEAGEPGDISLRVLNHPEHVCSNIVALSYCPMAVFLAGSR